MSADLHLHSSASDGVDDPAEVMAAAAAAGMHVVALTDHDTTAGWPAAAAAARALGLVLLPGAEISCQAGGISVHLLSYLHDPDDAALLAELGRTRADRVGRARRMVELLAADHPLSWRDVQAQVGPEATVGRPHIADALAAAGVVADREEAFATLLHRDSRYYLQHYAIDAFAAVRLVRAAGGVPVLAHARASRRGRVVSAGTIAELAAAGLLGLEADHPDHTAVEREELHALAGELGLLVTGSSDYHGRARPNRIGQCTTAPEGVEAIIAAGRGSAVVR